MTAPPEPRQGAPLALHRALAALDCRLGQIVKWLLVAIVTAMVLIVVLQVLARLLLFPVIWTSEATQNLMIWLTFVGGAAAFRHGEHIAVEMLVSRLGTAAQRGLAVFAHLLMLAFFLFFALYGWRLAELNASATGYTMAISQFWVFLAVPLGMALATLNALVRITGLLAGVPQGKSDAPEVGQ